MKQSLPMKRRRFLRAFDKKIVPVSPLSRLTPAKDSRVGGVRKGDRFVLYSRKKGFLSLFSLTLYGVLEGEDRILYSFGRCRPLSLIWLGWCAVLCYTGAILLPTEASFGLCFLLPGILLALPLFLFSKKEKARLLSTLQEIAHAE